MTPLSVSDLKARSGLPGPRGNLELFYEFLRNASAQLVEDCLAELADTTANSPEEFVGMCGVAGYALLHAHEEDLLRKHLGRYAAHDSWRIREAVAMAIQELPFPDLGARLAFTRRLETSDPFVHRAIVAGLCEPKNLRGQTGVIGVVDQLKRSMALLPREGRLSEGEKALRKALGYGWSVALVEAPVGAEGEFEALEVSSPHVRWVVAENLKKKRLVKWNHEWVGRQNERLAQLETDTKRRERT